MAKPTITGKLGFYYDGGTGDKWIHDGNDWIEFNASGEQGPPGADGAQGVPGADGTNGSDGAQGIQGIPGTEGAAGAKGDIGLTGANGTDGLDSTVAGPQGPIGADGSQGEPGTPADVSALVLKAGDTMTGDLVVDDARLYVGSASTSTTNGRMYFSWDNDNRRARIDTADQWGNMSEIFVGAIKIGLGVIATKTGVSVGNLYASKIEVAGQVTAEAPTSDEHLATKKYVDDNAGGITSLAFSAYIGWDSANSKFKINIPKGSLADIVTISTTGGQAELAGFNSSAKYVVDISNASTGVGDLSRISICEHMGSNMRLQTFDLPAMTPTTPGVDATMEIVILEVSTVPAATPPPAGEAPPQGLLSVPMDIAGLMPSKANCVAAATMIDSYDWSTNHTFVIVDMYGVIQPTYLIQYTANGANDQGSALYKFFATMLVEAK